MVELPQFFGWIEIPQFGIWVIFFRFIFFILIQKKNREKNEQQKCWIIFNIKSSKNNIKLTLDYNKNLQ